MLLEIVVDGIEIKGVRTRVRIPSAPFVFFVVVLNGQTPAYSFTTHKTSKKMMTEIQIAPSQRFVRLVENILSGWRNRQTHRT